MSAEPTRLRVLHVITRMIVGGAQENTMLSCALIDPGRFDSEIISGVETGSEGDLQAECERRGVRVRFEPTLVRSLHPIYDVIALLRLTGAMRRARYDVVHLHTSKAGILGRIAARMAGVPVVIHTAHGWAFSPSRIQPAFVKWLWTMLERFCARWCQVIVVVAESDRREALQQRVGRPEQYRLIRSGVEIDAYAQPDAARDVVRERFGIPTDAFVIGTVGRLSPQKAPLDLLSAFQVLAASHPDAHLVYVGDGQLRPEVEAAVARAGLEGRVHLPGIRRDVPELMRAFDVFALSSHWEGLPRVFPQAMAAGLPIVATRVDGAIEAITDGENGWLVDGGDTDAFGRRLIELANDPDARRRMGASGLARVDAFSARRMVDQLAALYEELHAEATSRSR